MNRVRHWAAHVLLRAYNGQWSEAATEEEEDGDDEEDDEDGVEEEGVGCVFSMTSGRSPSTHSSSRSSRINRWHGPSSEGGSQNLRHRSGFERISGRILGTCVWWRRGADWQRGWEEVGSTAE